jgi:hypothetical protein
MHRPEIPRALPDEAGLLTAKAAKSAKIVNNIKANSSRWIFLALLDFGELSRAASWRLI